MTRLRYLPLLALLATTGCSYWREASQAVSDSSYNPANWQLRPDEPPSEPTAVAASDRGPVPRLVLRETARAWTADAGTTAKQMVAKWSAQAGYTLLWDATVDRKIRVGATIVGTFEEAVQIAFNTGFQGPPSLTPTFIHGNRVLRVTQDPTLGQ